MPNFLHFKRFFLENKDNNQTNPSNQPEKTM
uniref:Uncharacterized protein n=1 Tax=viral metagenome TaxID=1070528 RepID=A0A6C0EF07_9ZZZZ